MSHEPNKESREVVRELTAEEQAAQDEAIAKAKAAEAAKTETKSDPAV